MDRHVTVVKEVSHLHVIDAQTWAGARRRGMSVTFLIAVTECSTKEGFIWLAV